MMHITGISGYLGTLHLIQPRLTVHILLYIHIKTCEPSRLFTMQFELHNLQEYVSVSLGSHTYHPGFVQYNETNPLLEMCGLPRHTVLLGVIS